MNPVRAGVVTDPKDYRWSGYGEAVGGSPRARAGIATAVAWARGGKDVSRSGGRRGCKASRGEWREVHGAYRKYLYCKGSVSAPGKGGGAAAILHEAWRREMEGGGHLPVAEAMRCRVRYFTDGVALGSPRYVEDVFRDFRGEFSNRRKSGPRRMRGSDWEGMTVLRDLRRDVFG